MRGEANLNHASTTTWTAIMQSELMRWLQASAVGNCYCTRMVLAWLNLHDTRYEAHICALPYINEPMQTSGSNESMQ